MDRYVSARANLMCSGKVYQPGAEVPPKLVTASMVKVGYVKKVEAPPEPPKKVAAVSEKVSEPEVVTAPKRVSRKKKAN